MFMGMAFFIIIFITRDIIIIDYFIKNLPHKHKILKNFNSLVQKKRNFYNKFMYNSNIMSLIYVKYFIIKKLCLLKKAFQNLTD